MLIMEGLKKCKLLIPFFFFLIDMKLSAEIKARDLSRFIFFRQGSQLSEEPFSLIISSISYLHFLFSNSTMKIPNASVLVVKAELDVDGVLEMEAAAR